MRRRDKGRRPGQAAVTAHHPAENTYKGIPQKSGQDQRKGSQGAELQVHQSTQL